MNAKNIREIKIPTMNERNSRFHLGIRGRFGNRYRVKGTPSINKSPLFRYFVDMGSDDPNE
jgi:hypothetical protein